MNRRLEAIRVIEQTYRACRKYEDASDDALRDCIGEYASAWTDVHALLFNADSMGRAIAFLMEKNRTLSGDNLLERGAIRGYANATDDDYALLHDAYVENLDILWRLLTAKS